MILGSSLCENCMGGAFSATQGLLTCLCQSFSCLIHVQAIIAQNERDQEIYALLEVMNKMYELVLATESLKKIEAHRKTMKLMCQQTVECALFIRDYASHAFSMAYFPSIS
jgi:hypothetical protein